MGSLQWAGNLSRVVPCLLPMKAGISTRMDVRHFAHRTHTLVEPPLTRGCFLWAQRGSHFKFGHAHTKNSISISISITLGLELSWDSPPLLLFFFPFSPPDKLSSTASFKIHQGGFTQNNTKANTNDSRGLRTRVLPCFFFCKQGWKNRCSLLLLLLHDCCLGFAEEENCIYISSVRHHLPCHVSKPVCSNSYSALSLVDTAGRATACTGRQEPPRVPQYFPPNQVLGTESVGEDKEVEMPAARFTHTGVAGNCCNNKQQQHLSLFL